MFEASISYERVLENCALYNDTSVLSFVGNYFIILSFFGEF